MLDKLLMLYRGEKTGFKAEPIQILALRRALGWSRQTFGQLPGSIRQP
jgi:hypothetical protein